jgi:hypothetical protein
MTRGLDHTTPSRIPPHGRPCRPMGLQDPMSGVRGLLGRAPRIVFPASWVSGLGLTEEGLFGAEVIAIPPGGGFPS